MHKFEREKMASRLLATYPTVAGRPVVRFTFDEERGVVYAHVETVRTGKPRTDRLVFCEFSELENFKDRTPSEALNGK